VIHLTGTGWGMSARDERQRDLSGPLMGIGAEATLLSAPILNAANDNQQGTQLTAVHEREDSVTCIRPERRRLWGGLAILVCAAAALACAAGWLYIVSVALLDNVTSFLN
jgi:ferric-dicitrate binding protein FerR (iron transport regulator)